MTQSQAVRLSLEAIHRNGGWAFIVPGHLHCWTAAELPAHTYGPAVMLCGWLINVAHTPPTSYGAALVAMSMSDARLPRYLSRTQPPTIRALKPLSLSLDRTHRRNEDQADVQVATQTWQGQWQKSYGW